MHYQETMTLAMILSEVLANFAFMLTDDSDVDPPAREDLLETSIEYHGLSSGSLRMTCTKTFATQLTSSILGRTTDGQVSSEEYSDAVKEFMNVLCGQFVTASYGIEDVFNLTIPVISAVVKPQRLEKLDVASNDVALASVDGQLIQLRHTKND